MELENIVRFYFDKNYTYGVILYCLEKYHGIIILRCTLLNCLKDYGRRRGCEVNGRGGEHFVTWVWGKFSNSIPQETPVSRMGCFVFDFLSLTSIFWIWSDRSPQH